MQKAREQHTASLKLHNEQLAFIAQQQTDIQQAMGAAVQLPGGNQKATTVTPEALASLLQVLVSTGVVSEKAATQQQASLGILVKCLQQTFGMASETVVPPVVAEDSDTRRTKPEAPGNVKNVVATGSASEVTQRHKERSRSPPGDGRI